MKVDGREKEGERKEKVWGASPEGSQLCSLGTTSSEDKQAFAWNEKICLFVFTCFLLRERIITLQTPILTSIDFNFWSTNICSISLSFPKSTQNNVFQKPQHQLKVAVFMEESEDLKTSNIVDPINKANCKEAWGTSLTL